MLDKNIVKDHQFTMMIGIVEIAMETIEIDSREEEHLLKDVMEEEVYGEDLEKGKRNTNKRVF